MGSYSVSDVRYAYLGAIDKSSSAERKDRKDRCRQRDDTTEVENVCRTGEQKDCNGYLATFAVDEEEGDELARDLSDRSDEVDEVDVRPL